MDFSSPQAFGESLRSKLVNFFNPSTQPTQGYDPKQDPNNIKLTYGPNTQVLSENQSPAPFGQTLNQQIPAATPSPAPQGQGVNYGQLLSGAMQNIGSLFQGNPTPSPTPNPHDPNSMKLTVGVSPNFVNEQRGGMGIQEDIPTPNQMGKPWNSRYANVWNQVLQSKGLDPSVGNLIARSENGKEIENYANLNHGDAAGTFDVGLTQVNVDPPVEVKKRIIAETKNMSQADANKYLNSLIDQGVIQGEAANLRKPEYSINKTADLYKTRLQNLGDPVLAIASYNLGSGGAVLDPQGALNRAKYVYNNSGIPLPNTPFTQDPEGFIQANMEKYKKLGLFK